MKKISRIIPAFCLAGVLIAGAGLTALDQPKRTADAAVYQENEYMKNLTLPTPDDYVEKDWEKTTIDYLTYVFDDRNHYVGENDNGDRVDMKIARYNQSTNAKQYFASIGRPEEAPEDIWSIPTYLGMGNDTTSGEALTVLGAVMSGALVGMDLTNYECSDGKTRNFVKSTVEYYQYANGERFVGNNMGSTTGTTFWYELLPGVLFSLLGTQYESESYYMYDIITETARQWQKAVVGLGGANADFWHTSYKFATGQPVDGNWYEPDAAAGMAYILYAAYSLNQGLKEQGKEAYATDEEIASFLQAATWSMNYLERLDRSPFYEVLTFLAPYLAARMNAEQGTNYDVAKMMSWLMDGSSAVRSGWGLVTENWGNKYTNGLMGSLTDGSGYAFAMNTFDAMLGFAPMVKYDTRFARDISRWVLCVSQSARNYYPSEYGKSGTTADPGNGNSNFWYGYEQSGNDFSADDPEASFIAYEGLRRYRRYVTWQNGTRSTAWDYSRSPYASGDAFTFNWGGITDYGLYGSSHVGLFGSTIDYTDVPMILRTDLSKLDVYSRSKIPFCLYYNPYTQTKEVSVTLSNSGNRLYDAVEKKYVEVKNGKISIPADTTFVLAEIPAGAEVVSDGKGNYTCNGEFIAQERGFVNLSLYRNPNGTDKIASNSSVEGTVYASLSMEVPEGATVESLTLEHGGVTLYSGTTAPADFIEIDTKQLKNGNGVMTATLTLSGGKIEKSTVPLQVLNVVKTPALSYGSTEEMASVWNEQTTAWNEQYEFSDHTSTMSANPDGSFTVTVGSPKGYGFVTSELFTIDLSRGPMLEYTVSQVNASIGYAIKVYVDGMEVHNNYTGAYILRDTNETGHFIIDILAGIKEEDRTFLMSGAHKASVKISPVGSKGDSVTFSEFNVYHMYTSPVLDEPDPYEWGHNFTSEWLSLWAGSASSGGVGDALLEYTQNGSVIVRASNAANDYSGVASPVIVTDLTMNPVFDLSVSGAEGSYFVGVKFEGNEKLYVLSENKTGTIEIISALRARYPEESDSFTGSVRMRVILGVKGDGEAEFSQVKTYYKLPEWGSTIRNDGWLDWENAEGATNMAQFALDSRNRFVITNSAATNNQTATAGVRGKFSLNLDYNPETAIRVRNGTGSYRFVISTFEGGKRYVLTDWSSEFSKTVTINLRSALGGALAGQQNIWFTIEVRGGKNYVEVDRMETFYTAVQPNFETGETLCGELASWRKDETNPSKVEIVEGNVVISENYVDSKGLYTDALTASAALHPHIVIDVVSLSEESYWYLSATIDGTMYALTGENGSTKTGLVDIDVVAALAAAGYSASGEFIAVYEIGGSGAGFAVEISSVRFAYRLASPTGISHDENANAISWERVPDADGYILRIENAKGEVVYESAEHTALTLELNGFGLETGVYRLYLAAYGDGKLQSVETRYAFKQGDIESVTLAAVQNYRNSGMLVEWDEVADVEYYKVVLTDADSGTILLDKELTQACLDLSEIGLAAFNFNLSVQAKGDGAVYLDGEKTEYAFYTNVLENYNASKFASMSASANQAYAEYDEATDTAAIRIPYTNWGGIVSLTTEVNFDRSPVLAITFASGCEGGYYLQIVIDGVTYYLADNTFTIHGNTQTVAVFVDICGTLASRKDGPAMLPTGIHTVAIVFGATSDGFSGVQTPVVKIASARLIEMTQGSGTKRLGTLATPTVSVDGRTASWNAVEHAESYTVVISNELGVLNTVTVTETTYDLSWILRADVYTIQVTANAAEYFSSDTGSATLTVTEDGGNKPAKRGCRGSLIGYGSAVVAVAGLAVASVLARAKRKDQE